MLARKRRRPGGHGSGSEDPPPRDAVIKITACAICGSDLHLLDGYQPTMESGDIIGHENMGEVIELGSEVTNVKIGDRVVVPFTISCGQCWFCQKGLFSCCDRTNPNAEMAARRWGSRPPACSDSATCSAAIPAAKRVSPGADGGRRSDQESGQRDR
jgi:threonine dehydrogenase-like Zn-dependent dehydrogenase